MVVYFSMGHSKSFLPHLHGDGTRTLQYLKSYVFSKKSANFTLVYLVITFIKIIYRFGIVGLTFYNYWFYTDEEALLVGIANLFDAGK